MTNLQEPKDHTHQDPLAEKIIARIEQEGVVPKPRWQFTLRDQIFWALWGLSLVFAALAVGAMIFALANAGWEFRDVTHDNFLSYVLDVLPFFWMAASIALLLFAYENVKQTKLGYRYPVRAVIGFGIVGIVFGGLAVFASGLGEGVEQEVGKRVPLYHSAMDAQRRMWNNPKHGLLGGEILQTEPGFAKFSVRAFDGTPWIVDGEDLRGRDFEYLAGHRKIRLIGVPVSGSESTPPTFHACFIFPWEIRGKIPPPAPSGEKPVRKFDGERSIVCRGVRPYNLLKAMRQDESLPIQTSSTYE